MTHVERMMRRKEIKAAAVEGVPIADLARRYSLSHDYVGQLARQVGVRYKAGPKKGKKQQPRFFANPDTWARVLYIVETLDRSQGSVADDLGISRQAVAQFRNRIIKHLNASTN